MPLADLGERAIGRAPSDECSGCMAEAREKPRAQLHQQAWVYDGSRTTVWFALALAIERSWVPGRPGADPRTVETPTRTKVRFESAPVEVFARTRRTIRGGVVGRRRVGGTLRT